MIAQIATYDVFISHTASDQKVATELATRLKASGLNAFHLGSVPMGEMLDDVIREALVESRAMIPLVSPDTLSSNMLVELGAATAWHKPVFVVLNGPLSMDVPAPFRRFPLYSLNRLDDVIHAIQGSQQPLTAAEEQVLSDAYAAVGIPADDLSERPKELAQLTMRFNKRAAKQYSEERVLSELVRLRKRGELQ